MNPPIWLVIGIGGAAGSIARYYTTLWTRTQWPALPWGTLIVNVSGSLLIGLLAGIASLRAEIPDWVRLGLMTGVLGGYTTFSAFSLDTLELWRNGSATLAAANIAANAGLSLAACLLGLWLARMLTA